MTTHQRTLVVGAGPYGLSVTAHLRRRLPVTMLGQLRMVVPT